MLVLHILNFLKKKVIFPKFKSAKRSKPSFYVDTDKINLMMIKLN